MVIVALDTAVMIAVIVIVIVVAIVVVVVIMVIVVAIITVMVIIMVMVTTIVAAVVAGVADLADAVLTLGGDVADVEALVCAEALGLKAVLLRVVVAAEVDATAAGKVCDGTADVAARLRRFVEVEVYAAGEGHRDERRHGQKSSLDVHADEGEGR